MKLDLTKVPDLKPNPLFKGLPESLKDPKNYKKIEKKLRVVLKSDHTHKTVKAYAKCEECQKNRVERQNMMKELGFKSIPQYLEWKKIMDIIINKKDIQLNA